MKLSTPTPYRSMSPEAQNDLIHRMAELRSLRPALTPMPRFLNRTQQQQIRELAQLLLHFPNCVANLTPIIKASVITDRDANRVLYILELMSNQVASELTVCTQNGERVILIDQQQSLRRGRPTANESEQRLRERQQVARAEAISHLTGQRIAKSDVAPIDTSRPTDTSRRNHEPDLFSSAVSDAISEATSLSKAPVSEATSISKAPVPEATSLSKAPVPEASPSGQDVSASASPTSPQAAVLGCRPSHPSEAKLGAAPPSRPSSSPSPDLKALREWSWILPAALSAKVKTLRDLRSQHASHSEQAKLLLEQGATSQQIAEHTQAAAAINEQIASLYAAVDRHLAVMYCMLSEVNPAYMSLADHYSDHGGINALISDLKPYYVKLTATSCANAPSDTVSDAFASAPSHSPSPTDVTSSLLSTAVKLNDAWIASTTRDPERDKRLHTIKAYFTRKDVSATQARLDKLRTYRQEAEQLKADADTLASMDLLIADCARQVTSPAPDPTPAQ